MTVLKEIAAERRRQVVKGYDAAHDDAHTGGQIAQAAAAFALSASGKSTTALMCWPWSKHDFDDGIGRSRENLIKAAAMAVAEIERLDRKRD